MTLTNDDEGDETDRALGRTTKGRSPPETRVARLSRAGVNRLGVPKSHLNFFPMGLGFPRVRKILSLGFPGIFSNGKNLCKITKKGYFGKYYGINVTPNEFVTF